LTTVSRESVAAIVIGLGVIKSWTRWLDIKKPKGIDWNARARKPSPYLLRIGPSGEV
jgi:hypothetical protein